MPPETPGFEQAPEATATREAEARVAQRDILPSPLGWIGGSQSFADYDRYEEAQDQEQHVGELTAVFQSIVSNIMWDSTLSLREKADKVSAAAAELGTRAGNAATEEDEDEIDADMREGLGSRVMRVLTGERAAPRKTEGGVAYRASDYAYVGDPEKPSTWKLRLAEGRSGKITPAQIGRAITALQPGGFRGREVELPKGGRQQAIRAIRAAIAKVGDAAQKKDLRGRLSDIRSVEETPNVVTVFREKGGDYRWLAIHTNSAWDSYDTRFTLEAHREYVDYVDRTRDFPLLRFWHIPGADLGRADLLAVDERDNGEAFVISTGTFFPEFADVAAKLAGRRDLACSHGFTYRPEDLVDGEFQAYRDFEVTFLPAQYAGNELTAFGVGDAEEVPMLPEAKKSALVELVGAERAAAIERGVSELQTTARERGIGFRELIEMVDEAAAPAATEQPAATEPAAPAAAAPTTEAAPALTLDSIREAMASTVADAVKPITDRLDAVEAAQREQGEREWYPRGAPRAGVRGREVDGDDPDARALRESGEKPAGAVPDGLGFYLSTPEPALAAQ